MPYTFGGATIYETKNGRFVETLLDNTGAGTPICGFDFRWRSETLDSTSVFGCRRRDVGPSWLGLDRVRRGSWLLEGTRYRVSEQCVCACG
jgi:hypothetical protein